MEIGPGITFGPNITINPPAAAAPPNYTTSGLVLYLDAGNINSYDATANTNAWLDLSGTGNHANVKLLTAATAGGDMASHYIDNTGGDHTYAGWEIDYAMNGFSQSGIAKVEPSASLRSNTGFTWEVLVVNNAGSARKVWLNIGGANGVRLGAKRSATGDFTGTGNFIELSANQQTTSNVYYTGIVEINGYWTHIVGTYDKTNLKLYVNTNLSTTAASNSNINYIGSYPLWIGGINTGDPAAYPDTINGGARTTTDQIAVVRIYNRALNSTEITDNFNQLAARYSMSTTLTL